MDKITIVGLEESTVRGPFRAYVDRHEGIGESPGQALDALQKQMGPRRGMQVILVQSNEPDDFFSSEDQSRLRELMDARRVALESGSEISQPLLVELESLIEKELLGATARTEAALVAV